MKAGVADVSDGWFEPALWPCYRDIGDGGGGLSAKTMDHEAVAPHAALHDAQG